MSTTRPPEADPAQTEASPLHPTPGTSGAALALRQPIEIGASSGRWRLVVGPRSLNATMLLAIARMAENGPVRVLDGGNRFNAYPVARAARGRPEVLNRITVSRAFTCYQVLSLLESTPALQARPAPLRLVTLDLLNTFYDESVRARERKQLLESCIAQLERLAVNAGAISVHPPAKMSETAVELLERLKTSPAVETFFVEVAPPPAEPLRLF
ncbi:MAG: hypothetical protein ACM3QS_05375 [Bacteroidota bacterium]